MVICHCALVSLVSMNTCELFRTTLGKRPKLFVQRLLATMLLISFLRSWKDVATQAAQSLEGFEATLPLNFLFLVPLLIAAIFFFQNEGEQKLLFFLGKIRVQLIEELTKEFLLFQGFLDEFIGGTRKYRLI